MITVIGLGVDVGDLTEKGKRKIEEAKQNGYPVLVRTAYTKSYGSVLGTGVEHRTLDDVYARSRSFSTLAKNLAKEVAGAGENAVYLVDGSATEDVSVKALCKRLRGKVEIIDGVSKITAILKKANFKDCSYTAVSAYELLAGQTELSLPLLVYDMDDRAIASDCKLVLGELYGEETNAVYLCGESRVKCKLYEIDRRKRYDYTSAVAIERVDLLDKTRFSIEDLQEIIVRLRKPDGCPWDRVQTNDSIKMSLIEEAYELVDAIDSGDDDKILEETGDVLLQAVFHAVLKTETGAFTLTDALTGICQNLISRHTHVFGQDHADNEGGALNVWEKNKMTEKHQVTFADSVNDVPKCFPALMRAQKVGKRAGKGGMDFASVDDALCRLREEIDEFITAYRSGDKTQAEKELGDVLFSAVNVGRKAGADCEKALKESVERFARRFTLAESYALQDGREVTTLTEAEWDEYYIRAKNVE